MQNYLTKYEEVSKEMSAVKKMLDDHKGHEQFSSFVVIHLSQVLLFILLFHFSRIAFHAADVG